MSSYKFDTVVNRHEAEALKEMIFQRARERAAALTEEVQSSYTGSMRNDIMDLARDSFVSDKNPFSYQEEKAGEEPEEKQNKPEIGFSQRHVENIKNQITYKNLSAKEEIEKESVEAAMADAHADFARKKSFMGALDFLNSQASMVLVKKHGKSFEALA